MEISAAGHVVWDWNGTLFDDHDVILDATNAQLAEHGQPPVEDEFYRQHFTRDFQKFYSLLYGREVTKEETEAYGARWSDLYMERIGDAAMTKGAEEATRYLADQGHTQSVLSMWDHQELTALVHELKVGDWFGHVEGYRDGSLFKGEHLVRHIDHVRSVLCPNPDASVVLIGDVTDDAAAADSFGIPCILVSRGETARHVLEETGATVVDTLEDAAKAAHDLLSS